MSVATNDCEKYSNICENEDDNLNKNNNFLEIDDLVLGVEGDAVNIACCSKMGWHFIT